MWSENFAQKDTLTTAAAAAAAAVYNNRFILVPIEVDRDRRGVENNDSNLNHMFWMQSQDSEFHLRKAAAAAGRHSTEAKACFEWLFVFGNIIVVMPSTSRWCSEVIWRH